MSAVSAVSEVVAASDEEQLVLIRAELARRHVASRSTGLIRLPRRLPKPEPPPEFWTQGEDAMAAELRDPMAQAAAKLREMLKNRRYEITPHAETDQ